MDGWFSNLWELLDMFHIKLSFGDELLIPKIREHGTAIMSRLVSLDIYVEGHHKSAGHQPVSAIVGYTKS